MISRKMKQIKEANTITQEVFDCLILCCTNVLFQKSMSLCFSFGLAERWSWVNDLACSIGGGGDR